MKNQISIVPNDLGAKIRVSKNNPEYAHVLLRQDKSFIGTNGWVKKNTLHTLLHGKLEDLQEIGIADMSSLPGQIVVKESHTPFNASNPDADLKYAGKTGIICCAHGEPIYRKSFYDAACTMNDELIAHTNGSDIREANNEGSNTLMAAANQKVEDNNQVDLEDSIAEVEAENEESMISHEELDEITASDDIEDVEEVEEVEVEEEEVTFEL